MLGSELRIVIVSLGSIGQRHLTNIRAMLPKAEIGVWRRLGEPPRVHTIPCKADHLFHTLDEVLAFAPDAAIIASPANTHLETALALAGAGIHILVEKPLSTTVKGVEQLIQLCNNRGLILMVGYNLRFMPSLRRVRTMVQEGAIGRVFAVKAEVGQYLPLWRPLADYRHGVSGQAELGGGALLELSHDIDYILWTLGIPDRITAFGGKFSDLEIDVEDLAEIVMEYDSPARMINIHLDMLQHSPRRCCRFIGSEGVLVWDGIEDKIDLFHVSDKQWRSIDCLKMIEKNQMYVDQLHHFLDCINARENPICDGSDGIAVLQVVDAARCSIKSMKTVFLKRSS